MKVASNFISMKAVPTMKEFGQKPLLGSYGMDTEGVPSQDVGLIENGILKGLLSSRAPVKGAERSNGHARAGGVAASVIRVESSNKKSYAQLKQELISAAKEEGLAFGYIVRGVTPASEALIDGADVVDSILQLQQGSPEPTQFRLTKPYSVLRVFPDGREEPVRGIEFGTVSINALKSVLATSDDETVYAYPVNAVNPLGGVGSILLIASGISS